MMRRGRRWLAVLVLLLLAPQGATAALVGHGGAVTAIAVTPDGARVLSAGFDNSLILWQLSDASKVAVLAGHEAAVTAVALFPDGRRAISGSDDQTVGMWDLEHHALIARGRGHRGKVAAVAVAPDGSLVASGGWDGELRLWNPATGDNRVLHGHEAAINAVAIAPDGRLLASGDHDGRILIWSLPEGRLIGTLPSNGFAVNALRFLPDARLLSTATDATVRLWDADAKRETARFEAPDEPLISLAISADGTLVAAGGATGTIRLWQIADGTFVRARYAHNGPVFALAFTPDGRRLLSGGLDGVVRVWQAPGWHEETGDLPATAAASGPDAGRGAALFRKCSACHDLTSAASAKAGPSLLGLFGRRAGALPGYAYSPALRESGLVWNGETVDRLFALGPEAVVPGSKMPLQRLPDARDRAELIEFLTRATSSGERPETGGKR